MPGVAENVALVPAQDETVQADHDLAVKPANGVCAGYVSQVRSPAGWLYLVVILDRYSRKVAGWAMGRRDCTTFRPFDAAAPAVRAAAFWSRSSSCDARV